MPKPKIICTLGTTTDDRSVLEGMVEAGMSCARINTAYASIDDYKARIDQLRQISPIDIMLDLKGPQVRMEADSPIPVEAGDLIMAGFADEPLRFNKQFYDDVMVGDAVLIENGTIETRVQSKRSGMLSLEVLEPGEGQIRNQMGVNVPGRYLNVARLSLKDKEVIEFGVREKVEYLALSFVRDYRDILNLKEHIDAAREKYGSDHQPGIIAKIEDIHGVRNLPLMLRRAKADGINLSVMVARGDLAVELPVHQLPIVQEKMIRICRQYETFVITATGLLESMQYAYSPARSEVVDVYHAVRQGSSALMLSGETSNGVDPVNATRSLGSLIDSYGGDADGA